MASAISVVEPLAVFGMAMLSYFTAELFHWSGIVSLIACGLAQAHGPARVAHLSRQSRARLDGA